MSESISNTAVDTCQLRFSPPRNDEATLSLLDNTTCPPQIHLLQVIENYLSIKNDNLLKQQLSESRAYAQELATYSQSSMLTILIVADSKLELTASELAAMSTRFFKVEVIYCPKFLSFSYLRSVLVAARIVSIHRRSPVHLLTSLIASARIACSNRGIRIAANLLGIGYEHLDNISPAQISGLLPVQDAAIIMPKGRTWKRWCYFASSRHTWLRAAEYEALSSTLWTGKVLDFGGGQSADYLPLMRGKFTYESVNIFQSVNPTFCNDLNKPLPIADETYDGVVSLNTFEHIRNDTLALHEALRVLKPGGQLLVIVPFLYQVHGSPSDFSRHTQFWWASHLRQLGIDPSTLRIEPLVWSRNVACWSILGNSRIRRIIRACLSLPAIFADAILNSATTHHLPLSNRAFGISTCASGFAISGRKSTTAI